MSAATALRFGRVEVRPLERRLLVDREPAAVGARAFDLLVALIERRDRLVSKGELLDLVWPDTVVEENNLQVHISALRKHLGPSAIATIPGRGYRFTLVQDGAEPAAPRPLPAIAPPGSPDEHAQIAPSKTNIGVAVEPLIGRDADVEAIATLLSTTRLVTVLGPGGIGKTRVALDVARGQVGERANGTWWVDLASIAAPERIAGSIADAAGFQLGEGDPALELAAALTHSHLLLVLDNCEHLVAGVARVAHVVLERAPRVTVLATSQIALKVHGEHVYRLDALGIPDADVADLAAARRHAAVQLLERRAQAADRRFALTEANVGAAVGVCRALEGVALAIEMAAARIPFMGLDAVRARLHDRFRMLSGSSRVAQGRHQTLLATLDWSHALLSPDEQVVLRRIGAFVGSFGMDTAKELARDEALDEWAVLDALGGLVDKSLLQVEQRDPPRYRLLETTRLYALARLDDAGEAAATRSRHALVMAALGDCAVADGWSLTDAAWHARYALDYPDLQAAFEYAAQHREPPVAASAAAALRVLDNRRGNVSRMRSRMEACFALIPQARGRAVARLWDGVMPSDQIAIEAIARLDVARERLAAWREEADPQALYAALCGWADELSRTGAFAAAEAALREAQALERPGWPLRLLMQMPMGHGAIAMRRKDAAGYRHHRREVLRLAEEAGDTRTATSARVGLGDAALLAEDYEEAATLSRAVIDDLRKLNRSFSLGIASENLANALVHLGDLDGASAAAAESLPLMRQNEAGADLFNILALIAVRSGEPRIAARMLGHVDAWVATSQYDLAPNEARAAEAAACAIDAAIGAAEHARLRREGATMSEAEADAIAFTVLGRRSPERPIGPA